MADHHMPAPRSAGYFSANHRDGRRDGLATPERRRNSSHEMGKSSNATSQRDDDDLFHDDGHDPMSSSHTEVSTHADDGHAHREERAQKKHKGRLGGGFLLHDAFGGGRLLGSRRQRTAHLQAPAPPTPQLQLGAGRDAAAFQAGPGPERGMRQSSAPIRQSAEPANSPPNTGHSAEGRMFADSHHQEPHPVADLDSSQIVHMALSLSESRRLASRRTGHRTAAPPRLAPLPDGSSSNNIRQHLQQQRKLSRTESPSLLQEPSSGALVPASRGSGNFQSSFEGSYDPQYRWQFSASTLARAHKAKVHLELLAQYRRLLDVLPPLKPGLERPLSGNSPDSPFGAGSQALAVTLGRQYNPLQYIRNRKVRARERKVIDGKRQGFSDVDGVRQWVDIVYQHVSMGGTPPDDRSSIPLYHSAEEADMLPSPADTATRPRRPRVDWFLDPCDVIADAYWLEQNGHKYLIEDRHWRKIFPQISSELSRPLSRDVEESSSKISPFTTRDNELTETITEGKEFGLSKVRSEISHSSAKERAKKKIQNIKGFHHRHASGGGGHHGKDSSSEDSSSDSDSEPKKRAKIVRKGTISSNSNDLLQKQMMEMVASEARERELEESALAHNESADDRSIEQPQSRFNSRRGSSLAEISDSERRAAMFDKLKQGSLTRPSVDHHSISPGKRLSLTNSPEAMPIRNGKSESLASVESSPLYSRSASPTRNPINKIKQLMRDKNGEARGGPLLDDGYDDGETRLSKRETNLARSGSTSTLGRGRRQSSPAGKLTSSDSSKNLRPMASTRGRTDEGVGLRGMFKGPRIDNVLRGGVSKLGDIIRKKDGPGENPDIDTTDESDSDRVRGRKSTPMTLSRKPSTKIQEGQQHQPKHFLDAMPEFRHMPSYRHLTNGGEKLTKADGSANSGRRPGEIDLLRPPQINVRSVSSSESPPVSRKLRLGGDSDVSEPESLLNNNITDGVRDADKRLNSAISLSDKDNQHGRSLGHNWAIADRSLHGPAKLTKREVARMRALILSSGVMAMEMHRRAYEQHKPFSKENLALNESTSQKEPAGVPWTDIARLTPYQVQVRLQLHEQQGPFCEMYPLAAQTLGVAIQSWGQRWQSSADYFRDKTVHALRTRVWEVRTHLADDLSEMARKAADEADEISRDLALGQPLKIKHVIDTMEKMLQTRRRRFRWLRRGLWLTVEWLLVGFMWYVWFMVVILRIFLGVGKGVLRGVKWLLWL